MERTNAEERVGRKERTSIAERAIQSERTKNDRAILKETKKDIEALKKRLSNLEGLYYRCWSKRILTESSVLSMSSEKVKKIINYEKAEIEKKYGKYSLSYMQKCGFVI